MPGVFMLEALAATGLRSIRSFNEIKVTKLAGQVTVQVRS